MTTLYAPRRADGLYAEEASFFSWPPGFWPSEILMIFPDKETVTLFLRKEKLDREGDLLYCEYHAQRGKEKLTVYND